MFEGRLPLAAVLSLEITFCDCLLKATVRGLAAFDLLPLHRGYPSGYDVVVSRDGLLKGAGG